MVYEQRESEEADTGELNKVSKASGSKLNAT